MQPDEVERPRRARSGKCALAAERNLAHRQRRVRGPGDAGSGESGCKNGGGELHGAATLAPRVAAAVFAHKGASPPLIESLQS